MRGERGRRERRRGRREGGGKRGGREEGGEREEMGGKVNIIIVNIIMNLLHIQSHSPA